MKLVVGLGNPGRKYEGTRHNVGYEAVAELVRRHGAGRPKLAFQGELLEVSLGTERTLLLCPHTYMNRSGASVGAAVDFYKLPIADVLVVCDDWNLPLGKLRIRASGSAGGQKGLQDILKRLGTEELARLRIGIGSVPPNWDAADYVLSRFAAAERTEMDIARQRAADAVTAWAGDGVAAAMNRYNGDA
ncbi:MAG: aminoacyl-tRNA hydrolase [Pirellulales bacterium]